VSTPGAGGSGRAPRTPRGEPAHPLYLIALNLTRRCNLRCAHCYLDADTLRHGGGDELGTAEVTALLDQVVAGGHRPMVVLTGGEPLLRRDLEAIVAHGSRAGLAMVLGSNGILLGERRVAALKAAGLLGAGISLDSLCPERHDGFRGRPGAWRRAMAGIEACRRGGLSFQIHFTVTEASAGEVAAVVDFARSAGARVVNVFFLVCTGRGERMTDISPGRYEEVLGTVLELQQRHDDIVVRARCAPHFKRIAFERDPDSPLNRISGRDGDGCIAASHYCRITSDGGVTACPYIPTLEGSIRERSFLEIWEAGPGLVRLRSPRLGGKCGGCEYRRLCGGCRARPLAAGGELTDADPMCGYSPRGGAEVVPLAAADTAHVRWSAPARARLARVPSFLRPLVRRRAEAYVAASGGDLVTAEHLSELVARRFGGSVPGRRPLP